MRKILAATVLLMIAVPVLAGSGQRGGGIDTQSFAWTTDAVSTTSTRWEAIDDLSVEIGCFRQSRSASATVSLEVDASAPVRFRAVTRGISDPQDVRGKPMKPGGVSFAPGTSGLSPATDSFSFTFVEPLPRNNHGTSFQVEWRSPSGGEVTLNKGSLNVLWDDIERDRMCI